MPNITVGTRLLQRTSIISPKLKSLLEQAAAEMYKAVEANLQTYNPASVIYVDGSGNKVCQGTANLSGFLKGAPADMKVYAVPQKAVDLSLEGGGALGFAHFGSLHALAARGIWCDRVTGTSAGSIAGCFVAAGYQVDLNFRTNVLDSSPLIAPDPDNSVNQILFGENFGSIPTLNPPTLQEIVGSWIGQLPNSTADLLSATIHQKVGAIDRTINVAGADFQGALQQAVPGLPTQLLQPIVNFIASLFKGGVDAIDNKVEAMVSGAVSELFTPLFTTMIAALVSDEPAFQQLRSRASQNVRDFLEAWEKPLQGLYRLLAEGAFWTGDEARDMFSRHLKVKVRGSGANGEVLFQDLPLDFACVATDVGKPGDPYDVFRTKAVVFSKKSTPLYPVAEAVRRSMSLPFVFHGRTLAEGFGIDPANVPASATGTGGGPISRRPPPRVTPLLFDNAQHYGRVLLDGGYLFNNPAFLFRDDSQFSVFDIDRDANGEPIKTLVISNLNAFALAPMRPDDIPLPEAPEPIQSILDLVGPLLPAGGLGVAGADSLKRLSLMLGATLAYGDLSHENEVDSIFPLLPNAIFIDIGAADPNSETEPNRFSAIDFAGPKTSRKWKAKSGWDATAAAFSTLEQQVPTLQGKMGVDLDPYAHILLIGNVVQPPAGQFTIAPRAKLGDTLFHDDNLTVSDALGAPAMLPGPGALKPFPLGQEVSNPVKPGGNIYVGSGATWFKIANTPANAQSNAAELVSFQSNLRCRVFLLVDDTAHPPFLRAQQWIDTGQALMVVTRMFRLFRKDFPAGNISLPGPRFGGASNNQLPYSVLAAPL